MIVARNPGSANKATSYAERLRLGIAVIHGEQKESESDMVDGRSVNLISFFFYFSTAICLIIDFYNIVVFFSYLK